MKSKVDTWKKKEEDIYIKNNFIPSLRPPAFNKSGSLIISGSDGNNFRARPLKHWRKQNTPNYEIVPAQKNKYYNKQLGELDKPGAILSNSNSCINECESLLLIPDWKINLRDKDNIYNKVGIFNELNKNNLCNAKCKDNIEILLNKIPVCDPPTNARLRVRYPSNVNSNLKKTNTSLYYIENKSYLQSRCKVYPESFTKTEKESIIDIANCRTNLKSNCFNNNSCAKQIYKNTNKQYSVNGAVNSSNHVLRKKYNALNCIDSINNYKNVKNCTLNNGNGLSNFSNNLSTSITTGSNPNIPFLFKTTSISNNHRNGGGAKINPIKCQDTLFRKTGRFTTKCLDNKYGKTIGHMQINITPNKNFQQDEIGFFSVQRQPKINNKVRITQKSNYNNFNKNKH